MESTAKAPLIKRPEGDAQIFGLPEVTDKQISDEVDSLTEADNKFWSSPNHDRSEYLHSFFQYPAMMVPVVQRKLIEIIVRNKPSILNVLDPYTGSGTSLVASMENGLNCYGQDINPLAILVSKTRTGPYYINAIKKRKQQLFDLMNKDSSEKVETNFKGLNNWFKQSIQIELSKIVRAIRKEQRPAIRRFYWVILAETVRLTSNDRTSTFKLHMRPIEEIAKRNVSAIDVFREHFECCIEDLNWYSNLLAEADKLSNRAYIGDVSLKLADSKENIFTPTGSGLFYDLLVTSPPYGDNKTTVTYGQHSYLPLQWIDLHDIHELATIDFLKSTSEIDSRGLGGKLKKLNSQELQNLFDLSASFRATYDKLQLKSPDKVKKVASFIYDLSLSIQNIHSALKMNAYQVWTIGNRNVGGIEIPNDKIITELIQAKGSVVIKKISREILNKRMAKRNKDSELMSFEDIIIFRKIE